MALVEKVTRRLGYRPGAGKLADQVLFVSFGGKQVSDSPLDIYRELVASGSNLKLIWAVRSEEQNIPVGATKVVVGTSEWFTALAKSKYLVSNNNLPMYFRKSPGQIYLQTWHGTPLKKIGTDIKKNLLTPLYNLAMKREAGFWDYLISPNEFSSEIFPRAFEFRGRLLETGYPRNDRLTSGHASTRETVREQLGVSNKETVVLYAPTWRDDAIDEKGGWATVNKLEATSFPKGIRILYRGHTNTLGSERNLDSQVIDVTTYPDVTDLYLAADVLVTDYSSVMFDFSVTGKPMLFLCPDLDNYEGTRGFYFDFAKSAPGPILKSSKEVAVALQNLDKISRDYREKYTNWRSKFNRLEDGKAASRVVAAVFHA
jgi:CDP-glycerol glycerophosphotransferase